MVPICLVGFRADSPRLTHHPIRDLPGSGIFVPRQVSIVCTIILECFYFFVQELKICRAFILSIRFLFRFRLFIPSIVIARPLVVVIIIVSGPIQGEVVFENIITL